MESLRDAWGLQKRQDASRGGGGKGNNASGKNGLGKECANGASMKTEWKEIK